MRLRILVHAPTFPRPDLASGDRRFFALLGMMAGRHEVDFCPASDVRALDPATAPADADRYARDVAALGVRVWPAGKRGVLGSLAGRFYDVLFLEFAALARSRVRVFRWCQPHARVVIDSVDVHFARLASEARLGLADEAAVRAARAAELAAYRSADAVAVVTPEDAAALAAEPPMPPTFLVPNVVPTRPRAAGPRGPDVVFVGGFAHPPNVDGIRWFVTEAWPIVRAAVPSATLTVVGAKPPPEVLALADAPGVRVTGFVPDTAPYLDRAAVSVAPLRAGAGMKGKVTEALAHGLPVVTTTIGAQGFGGQTGVHYWVADEAAAFAAAVAEALTDPARAAAVGLAGQQLAEALCGPAAVGRQLDELLAAVAPPAPRRVTRARRWLRSAPVRVAAAALRGHA